MHLYDRAMSAIPVSIGTSLALESIFKGTQAPYDATRKIPIRVKLSDYQECYLNLSTLIRNIAHASDRETYFACPASHVLEILLTEIDIIQSVFNQEGYGVCKPVFYSCSYKSLATECDRKGVKLRQSTTPFQKSYDLKEETVLKQLLKQTDSIKQVDSEIRPERSGTNALIISHIPYDLLSRPNFGHLALLESHTGVLKSQLQWNTKYAPFGKESMDHLPFHKSLLLIFGDKHQIEPGDRKLRQKVYDISVKSKWTPLTTMERVRDSYREHITHPADLTVLLSY